MNPISNLKTGQEHIHVSVVIPCFRCTTTIQRALDSVIHQTYKPAEVILIDDGSGDGTLTLLRTLERQYPGWVKVVAQTENLGPACARNIGWGNATQPYIAFLDADDSWNVDKLRIQYEYMQNNPNVVLCGHQCVWLCENEMRPMPLVEIDAVSISAKSLLFKNAFNTPTVMLKRSIPFRFQNGKHCAEDLLLWQQIAFSGLSVIRLESPLAYVHKPLYGAAGLSARLWRMEKGELSNFIYLYRTGSIGIALTLASLFFSMIKFVKRVFVTSFKNITKYCDSKEGLDETKSC